MTVHLIDRRRAKAEANTLLRTARVSPKAFTALYFSIILGMDLLNSFVDDSSLFSTFFWIFVNLIVILLNSGFTLYCMAIRRHEEAEFLTLFDGFSFAGKVVALNVVRYAVILLWSFLFVIPGLIASYRYRFALMNLYENPELGVFECMRLSAQQTMGYKSQLLMLDLSYLGWTILARVPALAYDIQYYSQLLAENTAAFSAIQTSAAASPALLPTLALPALGVIGEIFITDVWMGVVSLFYMPQCMCVELEYFDIARGAAQQDSFSSNPSWHSGRDED